MVGRVAAGHLGAVLGPVDPPLPMSVAGGRLAAVLALISAERDELLLIERSRSISDPHSGQLAFPGGRHEADDRHLLDTALRETLEEVGLPVSMDQVCGSLAVVDTSTGYQVQPFVAVIGGRPLLRPSGDEVADTLWIPIAELADAQRCGWQPYRRPDTGLLRRLPYFDFADGRRLWGATAVMVVDLLRRAGFFESTHPFAGSD